MTLPSLIANYRSKVAVAQLKKMYSVLSQAVLFTVQKNGDYSSLYEIKDHDPESIKNWYITNLKPYLKVTNECFGYKKGCWADTGTKQLDGSNPEYNHGSSGIGNNIVVFNTVDGYAVGIDAYLDSGSWWGVNLENEHYVVIHVDVNGKKLPNVIGKDTFIFVFSERGFIPAGHDLSNERVNASCSKSGKGSYCFEKIMRNSWQIDKENLW